MDSRKIPVCTRLLITGIIPRGLDNVFPPDDLSSGTYSFGYWYTLKHDSWFWCMTNPLAGHDMETCFVSLALCGWELVDSPYKEPVMQNVGACFGAWNNRWTDSGWLRHHGAHVASLCGIRSEQTLVRRLSCSAVCNMMSYWLYCRIISDLIT